MECLTVNPRLSAADGSRQAQAVHRQLNPSSLSSVEQPSTLEACNHVCENADCSWDEKHSLWPFDWGVRLLWCLLCTFGFCVHAPWDTAGVHIYSYILYYLFISHIYKPKFVSFILELILQSPCQLCWAAIVFTLCCWSTGWILGPWTLFFRFSLLWAAPSASATMSLAPVPVPLFQRCCRTWAQRNHSQSISCDYSTLRRCIFSTMESSHRSSSQNGSSIAFLPSVLRVE